MAPCVRQYAIDTHPTRSWTDQGMVQCRGHLAAGEECPASDNLWAWTAQTNARNRASTPRWAAVATSTSARAGRC